MPSKQIREFLQTSVDPAVDETFITSVRLADLMLYQQYDAPYTNYGIEVDDVFKSLGYTYGPAGVHTGSSVTLTNLGGLTNGGGFVKILQDSLLDSASLQLWASKGSYTGGKWNLVAGPVASSGPAGEFKIQSYVEGTEWTDIVTIDSGSQSFPDKSEVTIKDRLAATSLILDGGKIHYQDAASLFPNPTGGADTLHLEHDIDLVMMGGVDAADTNFVKWDSGTNTLEFKGAPVSDAVLSPVTTHILMDDFSLLGFGGDNGAAGNYLTAGKTDEGDDSEVPGLRYSGSMVWATNQQVDFEIKNRDTSDGGASLTLTADNGTTAGDMCEIRYGALSNGAGSSGVMSFGIYTDHGAIGTPYLPMVVGKIDPFDNKAHVGIHGSAHIEDELRLYGTGVNFPGHMIGGRTPAAKYTGLKGPGTIATSHVYEMPAAFPGSDMVLQSTDAGVMSWVTLPSTGTGTVEAGTQYKVAYYPNVDQTLVNDTSALYWKSDRLGVNEDAPQTDVHLKSTAGPTIRLERDEADPVENGDKLGTIEFYGVDEHPSDPGKNFEGVGASIVAAASGIWSYNESHANDTQTELQFWTTPDGEDSLTKRLTIKDSGVIKHEKATQASINSPDFAASLTIDLDESDLHKVTLTGNVTTLIFVNSKEGQRFILRVLQDGAGSRTINWSGLDIKWAGGGTEPVLTSTPNRATVLGFLTTEDTKYDGFVIGKDIV